jgi:hypothetical protein
MKTLQLLALTAAAATLLGCEPDYEIQVRYLTSAPAEVQMDTRGIFIPKGVAVGVEIIPIEDDEQMDEDVDMVPTRPGIIGIDLGLEERTHVIYGVEEGATSIDVYFDDEQVFTMSAQVTSPIFQ